MTKKPWIRPNKIEWESKYGIYSCTIGRGLIYIEISYSSKDGGYMILIEGKSRRVRSNKGYPDINQAKKLALEWTKILIEELIAEKEIIDKEIKALKED